MLEDRRELGTTLRSGLPLECSLAYILLASVKFRGNDIHILLQGCVLRPVCVKRVVRGLARGLPLSQVVRQPSQVGLKLHAFVLQGPEFIVSVTMAPDLPLQNLRQL